MTTSKDREGWEDEFERNLEGNFQGTEELSSASIKSFISEVEASTRKETLAVCQEYIDFLQDNLSGKPRFLFDHSQRDSEEDINMKVRSSQEFVVGKHGIGWVDSDFKARFGQAEFDPRALGTYHTLTTPMSGEEMLSVGGAKECELGDVLAFLQNPPAGTNDGYANIFVLASCVVDVYWFGSVWNVGAWSRGRYWYTGRRVFSPATVSQKLGPAILESLDTRALGSLIAYLEPVLRINIGGKKEELITKSKVLALLALPKASKTKKAVKKQKK